MVKQQDATPIHTNDQLGELAGTSRETIRKYKVVQYKKIGRTQKGE